LHGYFFRGIVEDRVNFLGFNHYVRDTSWCVLSYGQFPAKRLVENYLRRMLDLGEDTGVSVDGVKPRFIACVEGLSGK